MQKKSFSFLRFFVLLVAICACRKSIFHSFVLGFFVNLLAGYTCYLSFTLEIFREHFCKSISNHTHYIIELRCASNHSVNHSTHVYILTARTQYVCVSHVMPGRHTHTHTHCSACAIHVIYGCANIKRVKHFCITITVIIYSSSWAKLLVYIIGRAFPCQAASTS